MPENIINLDERRRKAEQQDPQVLLEQMSVIEDIIEQMDELGVTTREELAELLEALESSTPENPD